MPGVDTHCHVQMSRFDEDREAVIARALDSLDWLIVVGDSISGSRAACSLTRQRIYASVGVHPYHAAQWNTTELEALQRLAGESGVLAIGETGLDYYNEYSPRNAQRPCFEQQLRLAIDLRLPVVVHSRDAEEDTLAILQEHIADLPACVMHCFGGDAAFAEACLAMGCHISFAGNVTYPKAEQLREAATCTPLDRLLVETDAPYLAPQCKRGTRCEPAFVQHTTDFLAALKNISPEMLREHIIDNAQRVFAPPCILTRA